MRSHILPSSKPVVNIEIGIIEPSISIGTAAPHSLRDVVVQVQIDTALIEFFGNSIVNLQACDVFMERGIVLEDFVIDLCAVLRAEGFDQSGLDGHIFTTVFINLVDEFDSVGETDGVHANFGELTSDVGHRLVLKSFGDHGIGSTGPVSTDICDGLALAVVDPAAAGV